ncbi:MAG: hypothetical protein ACK4RZ_17245 [Paracoccaceae bacterium]
MGRDKWPVRRLTGTATYGLGSGATTNGTTKTVNIGTGGVCQTLGAGNGSEITVLVAETFSPEPNMLECKFADYLAQHSTNNDAAG